MQEKRNSSVLAMELGLLALTHQYHDKAFIKMKLPALITYNQYILHLIFFKQEHIFFLQSYIFLWHWTHYNRVWFTNIWS